jgi:hypothetical protein
MGIAFWTYLGFIGHLVPLGLSFLSVILEKIVVPRRKQSTNDIKVSEPVATKSEKVTRSSKKE